MQFGAIVECGATDWQIFQQMNQVAQISLNGVWNAPELNNPRVFIRVVREEDGSCVVWWQPATMAENRWYSTLTVPAGGLYRIETCVVEENSLEYEWGVRGDMVHHIGVGDLYVIAGQSNSAGYGKDPVYDPPELGVHLLKNSGKWDLATHPMNDSTCSVHPVNTDYSNTGHSPYLAFAKALRRRLNYPIGLLQAALGGSALSAWEDKGVLYQNMLQTILSQGGIVKGILWYQGCTDTENSQNYNTYLERFSKMVERVRAQLDQRDLPFLTVQINRSTDSIHPMQNEGWSKVREAQRQAAFKIPNVYVVPSSDSAMSDNIHNSASSNLVIGERLYWCAIRHIYGQPDGFDAPDIHLAELVSKNRIRLSFSHVQNRLFAYYLSTEQLGFETFDAIGPLPVMDYKVERDSILLTFCRDIKGKCFVNGGTGQCPASYLPVDFASHMPILSFYGVEVSDKTNNNLS